MSKTSAVMLASSIPDHVKYLNDRGCDVIQILNPGGYWQIIVYNEPKNIMYYLRASVEAQANAIKDMVNAIDYAILKLTS